MLRRSCSWRRPLQHLLALLESDQLKQCADYYVQSKGSKKLLDYSEAPYEARDIACVMMKVYTGLNDLNNLRATFEAALRELPVRYLNTTLFDHHLECLLHRSQFSQKEVMHVLAQMQRFGLEKSPLTYLYLAEFHVRMKKDPQALIQTLFEDSQDGRAPHPSPALIKTLFFNAPGTPGTRYHWEIVQRAVRARIDRSSLANVAVEMCADGRVAPEHALWLLFEFEARCILDKAVFHQSVQKKHLVQLMLRASKCADALTIERVMSSWTAISSLRRSTSTPSPSPVTRQRRNSTKHLTS
jgi:hypothetical protein